MNVLNLNAARGADRNISVADAGLIAGKSYLLRINDANGISQRVKTNNIFIDNDFKVAANGTGTLTLKQGELDLLPDAGNYIVYEILSTGTILPICGGTFTISGNKTQQVNNPVYVPFQNGSNQRTINQVDLPVGSVLTTLTNDDDYVIFSGFEGSFILALPDAAINKGKIFHIKCLAATPDFILQIQYTTTLSVGGEVTLVSNGLGYEIWDFSFKTPMVISNPALITDNYTLNADEDVLVVNSLVNNQEIIIHLPADRTGYYGKLITVICTGASNDYPISVFDDCNSSNITGMRAAGKLNLYLIPGTANGDSWIFV